MGREIIGNRMCKRYANENEKDRDSEKGKGPSDRSKR